MLVQEDIGATDSKRYFRMLFLMLPYHYCNQDLIVGQLQLVFFEIFRIY